MQARHSGFQAAGKHSERVKRLRRIAEGEELGLAVLDGVKLVIDVAARGAEILEVYGVPDRLEAVAGAPGLAALARGDRFFTLDETTLQRLAPTRTSQGVLAVVAVPARTIAARGVAVLLADVQDPGNVGSVIRCAAAFGASGVACSPGCAEPFSPRALRASAGHALFLPVERAAALATLAARFATAGGTVAAGVASGGVALPSWRPRPPVLIVLGNEGQGIPARELERCQVRVTIPVTREVESLNVAVTAGIILFNLRNLSVASADQDAAGAGSAKHGTGGS